MELALPYRKYAPASSFERGLVSFISSAISTKFRQPESEFRFGWITKSALMEMPETPMHEDNPLCRRKDEVRSTGQIAPMEAKAIAQPVRFPTNKHFGRSVA